MANANSQFGGFMTGVGVVKQTNANALQVPWKITRMQLGDAGGEPALFPNPTPNPAQTALINVVYDAQLNALYPSPGDPGVLIAELVLPPNVGGWWIRETALLDEDGDLIAVAAPAPSYKPLLVQGSGRTQTIRMHVVFGNTANVTLKIDPSVVLATRAQVEAGDIAARAYAAQLNAAHLAAADPHPQYGLRGAITSLNASTALTAAHEGLVLVDAAVDDCDITLPPSAAELGVRNFILRRTDITANQLTITAAGNDMILLDASASAIGQMSTELIFGGDWLHLRSDGLGRWWCIGQAQLPGSLDSGLTVFSTAGAHEFVVPAVLRSGRRRARVTVEGAGGGAGGYKNGGGGGGGGGVAKRLLSLAGVVSVSVTVGTGGAGAPEGTAQANGQTGGTSSFGVFLSATGGRYGNNWVPGKSGTGIGGDINTGHGPGTGNTRHEHDIAPGATSAGGVGGGPNGGVPSGSGTVPSAGTEGGIASGGGGGNANGTNYGAGGKGGPGRVTVEW